MAVSGQDCAFVPLGQLLSVPTALQRIEVSGITLDSRTVVAGDLFLALPGTVHDGREYIAEAVARGASAIVAQSPAAHTATAPLIEVTDLAMQVGLIADRFYGQPTAQIRTLAVTGTNGKTTVSQLIAQFLRLTNERCGVIGTLGATLEEEVIEVANTTPDALSLHAQLAQWRDEGVSNAVLEVSSHALDQGRVSGVRFESAVFTNLSRDHLDYHGDMDSYGAAKSRLFKSPGLKRAILNRDDLFTQQLRNDLPGDTQPFEFSLHDSQAQVFVTEVCYHSEGVRARVHSPWGSGQIDSCLLGEFNLSNLLAALTAVCSGGLSLAAALQVVPQLHGAAGRMQSIANTEGLQVLVDYAHTPDALEKALLAMRVHVKGQLYCVFGCGGDRDRGKRPLMGEAACSHSDVAVLTSDNPRDEDPRQIIDDVLAGCHGTVLVEADRSAAIALAISSARPGDGILVAGKGHESYQQVGAQRLPFDDAQQVRLALAGRVRT